MAPGIRMMMSTVRATMTMTTNEIKNNEDDVSIEHDDVRNAYGNVAVENGEDDEEDDNGAKDKGNTQHFKAV